MINLSALLRLRVWSGTVHCMTDLVMTTSPDFEMLGWKELKRLGKGVKRQAKLAPGVQLLRCNDKYGALASRMVKFRPIFVRHINPVHRIIELTNSNDDLKRLKRSLRDGLVDSLPVGKPFSVQTRIFAKGLPYKPFDINKQMSQTVEQLTGATLNVRQPEMVVSVVVAQVDGATVALVGVSPVQLNLSDWAGGERRFKREKGQVSRAEFKLLEAIEAFEIKLPKQGVAVDLGAAPGGWTRVLRNHHPDLVVVAVDPGELHPSFKQDWGVRHVRHSAEFYQQQLDDDEQFDLIVNDMRLDASRSADTLARFEPHLKPEGFALMTIKLPQYHALNKLLDTEAQLSETFEVVGIRHLFHNRNEVTAYLKRKNH